MRRISLILDSKDWFLNKKFYWKTGRDIPGVYDDWEECRRQVHRFSGNSYKGYTTRAEAESRYARYLAGEGRERWRNRMKTSFIVMMLIVMTAALFYVMVV